MGGVRLCVVECLHWGKAFGPETGFKRHRSGNSACPKILVMEVGSEVNGKVQALTISKNNPALSHKWVWTHTRLWVEGSPCSPAVYNPASFPPPVTGGASLGARKMPCYFFVKVFSSRAEADRGWRRSLLRHPFLKYKESISISSLYARKWCTSQDVNIICRQ